MEKINREAKGRRKKPKLKERGKGEDRSVMGKKGELKQKIDQIRQLKLLLFFHDAECGTPSHNSPHAIQDLTVH